MNNRLKNIEDSLSSCRDAINKIAAREDAYRMVIYALIASHANIPEFISCFEKMRETFVVNTLYTSVKESSVSEAERILDYFSRPWKKQEEH